MMKRPCLPSFPYGMDGSTIFQHLAAKRERTPGVETSHPLKSREEVGEEALDATVVTGVMQ